MITCPGCGRSVDDHLTAACPDCGAALIVEVAADPPPVDDSASADAAPPPPVIPDEVSMPAGTPGGGSSPPPPPGADAPPQGSTGVPPGDSGSGGPLPPEGSSVPFEDRSLPLLERLIETIKLAFVDPVRLFSAVPEDSDIGPAVLYGVILGTIGWAFSSFWQLIWGDMFGGFDPFEQQEAFSSTGFTLLMLIFSPVFIVIYLFVATAIFHVSLYVLGDGKRGFSTTLRVVAYGGTPALLGILPLCGGIVGYVWSVALLVIGASQAHGTEWWRALLAYVVFPMICCCMIFGLGMLFGLAGASLQ